MCKEPKKNTRVEKQSQSIGFKGIFLANKREREDCANHARMSLYVATLISAFLYPIAPAKFFRVVAKRGDSKKMENIAAASHYIDEGSYAASAAPVIIREPWGRVTIFVTCW